MSCNKLLALQRVDLIEKLAVSCPCQIQTFNELKFVFMASERKRKHLKNKRLDFQIFCKRNNLASSAETTRKRVRQKFDIKKDPDGQSSSVKIHKKQASFNSN